MLEEIKELVVGFGVALGLLIGFVWIRERILNRHRPESEKPPGESAGNYGDSESHQAMEHMIAGEGLKPVSIIPNATPRVNKIFITHKAGEPMQPVQKINALANRGLQDDRYCTGCGYWSESDKCEVTLIAQEALDHVESATGIKVQQGQHRRNIVTSNLDLDSLKGKRFRIGTAFFAYGRPRPPCLYIQKLTEPGMVKALAYCGGICVRCFRSGVISENDVIEVLDVSVGKALRHRFDKLMGRS